MRSLKDVFATESFVVSFEIFPPKTEQGDTSLMAHLERLAARSPAFISCTYGAGGSTRGRTIDLCRMIQEKWGQVATAHFTCVGSTRKELMEWLAQANDAGIQNIMALRGDPPAGQESFQKVEGGLGYANELVEMIREEYPEMGIGVAGYPEKHPEAKDHASDLTNLQRKVNAGGDAVFTQLFFVNDHFFQFRDRAKELGIEKPIVPGIMPITEFARIKRIVSMCKTDFPQELSDRLEAVQDDKEAQFDIGIDFAIQQCQELIDNGAPGIHFYVLNKSDACERILDGLKLPATAG